MKTGIKLIAEERARQIAIEQCSADHDDTHKQRHLMRAAGCYLDQVLYRFRLTPTDYQKEPAPFNWPWAKKWWKPTNPIRDLVKAGALIAAEIDRLQRLEDKSK